MVNNAVILAGGAGKRLWPASLGNRPKQFMLVDGSKSLFRETMDRAFDLGIKGRVYVVAHENHVDAVMEECRFMAEELRRRILIMAEPVARNTAPALALAAAGLSLEGRVEETVLVMAADHFISPLNAFADSIEDAAAEAERGFLVSYGIVPHEAATGYGYLELGEREGRGFRVLSFREKPDAESAQSYLDSGRHYWNAGIFTYRTDVFQKELAGCDPGVASAFRDPDPSWFRISEEDAVTIYSPTEELRRRYRESPAISVDYAVMERTKAIRAVRGDFSWNDVGSWDAVSSLNMKSNSPQYQHESSNNFVYSDQPVALCGVDNLIVVAANNRVLVCRRGMSQLVKNAAEDDLKST